jgi:Uroporphyrinogen decarboxylase (URO-D)
MAAEPEQLFEERLARYQATIALEPTDRMMVAGTGANNFAEIYAGYSRQEIMYDINKWMAAESKFAEDFSQIDILRAGRIWGPMFEAVGFRLYRLPGRDLPANTDFQFVEGEWMKADEYDLLIDSPVEFMMERRLPRIFGEFKEKGSARSYMAFLKSGMAYVLMGQLMREKALNLEKKYGLPQPMQGKMSAPFDILADGYRGLQGIMIDLFERPGKVTAACEALIPDLVNCAIAEADPLKRYPIFMPLHRGNHPFLSPKQFNTFYWPSLHKAISLLIEAGYTIRAFLEGDWTPNWHHWNEFPKGKILCDIDNKADIVKAKQDIGGTVCLAGGIPDRMFMLGTPEEMRTRVKELCETVGKDGGVILNGGCAIPYLTKPENFRAFIDATLEYGNYSNTVKPKLKKAPATPAGGPVPGHPPRVITPWEVKASELGEVMGDEGMLKETWEMLERRAFCWLHFWDW